MEKARTKSGSFLLETHGDLVGQGGADPFIDFACVLCENPRKRPLLRGAMAGILDQLFPARETISELTKWIFSNIVIGTPGRRFCEGAN